MKASRLTGMYCTGQVFERADAVAVVTDLDVLNAVVGHLARTYYHVPNVIVRNTDPRYRPILEAFGLQVVSAFSWGAQRIEEMIYHADVRAVFSAGNGEVEVYEAGCAGGMERPHNRRTDLVQYTAFRFRSLGQDERCCHRRILVLKPVMLSM